MAYVLKLALGLVMMAAAFAGAAWIAWRTLKRTDDPERLVFKWIVTAVAFVFLLYLGLQAPEAGIVIVIIAAIFGIFLGILWAPHLGALLASPLEAMYTGGGAEVEARPFYSIAQAKRKQGKYEEAIARVQEQLAKFPSDYDGLMLLAEIHGEDLKDNNGAQAYVEAIVRHEGRAPKNVAFALSRSADWHLRLAQDREAAKASLSRIPELLPDTELAQTAWQRLAHLTSDQMLAEQKERPRIALTRHEGKLGLEGRKVDVKVREEDPAETAGKLVAHLNEHPFDAEAREQLARVYAEHYGRLDMAVEQLEQLISSPNPQPKQVVHWLNALADLHIRLAADRAAAEAALKRIVERFPDTAGAANAEKRIAYLGLEMKKNTQSQAVQLGSYAQNIGLQGQTPKQP